MKCDKCGQVNTPEANSCTWCGTPLVPSAVDSLIPHRDLGQIISYTFDLYGKHFWKFILIVLPVQILGFAGLFLIPEMSPEFINDPSSEGLREYLVTLAIVMIPYSVVIFVATLVSQGATMHAVGRLYMGREINVQGSYRLALSKVWIMILAGLLLVLGFVAAMLLSVVIIGIPIGFILAISWAFVFPIIMIEGGGPVSALGRSFRLVRGSRWRVLGIGIVFVLISLGIAVGMSIAVAIVGAISEPVGSLVSTIGQALLAPLWYIGLTIVYFDLRTRREGLTVDSLAMEMDERVVGAASSDDLRDM